MQKVLRNEYEKENAINCIEELKQFTKRNGSIIEKSMKNNPIDRSRNKLFNRIKEQNHSPIHQADYIIDSENNANAHHNQTQEQAETKKQQPAIGTDVNQSEERLHNREH